MTLSQFRLKRYISWYAVAVLICLSFLGGMVVGSRDKTIPSTPIGETDSGTNQGGEVTEKEEVPEFLKNNVNFGLYWNIWNVIKETYVDPSVPETQLFYGSLQGMVSALNDPYSAFFTPDVTKEFTEQLEGKFEGIGAEITIRDKVLTVVSPIHNSPAEKAGVKAGDLILKIDGEDTQNMYLDQAVSKIRGAKGTSVTLSLFREGMDEPKDYTIVRDTIKVESVTWEMKESGKIAYVKLNQFNEVTMPAWNQFVAEVQKTKPQGIILDLRNDPGGFLDTAIEIASDWIPSGPVVIQKGRDGGNEEYASNGMARLADYPTVVLINGGSASASEIVAGALQDYGKATIVGEKSFGKGSVQDFQLLPDGSALKLTIAKWLTPKGRVIDGVGITPDQELIDQVPESGEESRHMNRAIQILLDPNFVPPAEPKKE